QLESMPGKQLSFIALLLYIAAAADVGKSAASAATLTCPEPGHGTAPASASLCAASPTTSSAMAGAHCPDAADESLELCKRRRCAHGQFACAQSPGHCLPATMRCDGSFDCERTGLADYSDEMDCPAPGAVARGACGPTSSAAWTASPASPAASSATTSRTVFDGSDESPDICRAADCEFHCDGRCLKASVRCDGTIDCSSGQDEIGCPGRAFSTGKGPRDPACVPINFVCDGISECLHGGGR
uniref:EGF-like domain-containing protein n=1 Tax=Macrostomum lignano TaxID=282301 RepID=A0A1I8FEB7_9PLAT